MIEGIDVFIISACTELVFARQFLQWIDYTSIPQSAVVIVRLPFANEEKPILTYHASWWLQDMGLTPEGKETRGSRISRKIRRKTCKDKYDFCIICFASCSCTRFVRVWWHSIE